MNKKQAFALSWLILCVAGTVCAIVLTGSWGSAHRDKSRHVAAKPAAPASFQIGVPQRVYFDADPASQGLSLRERQDQARDWLLWAVVSRDAEGPEAINKVLYDLPPVRHSYLHPVARFEYGTTRSTALDNGNIIALVPKTDNANQRADDLAQIVDNQRKNLGGAPQSVLVYEYRLDGIESADITRLEPIQAASLLTKDSGLVTEIVSDDASLGRFLSRTSDLVSAKLVDSGLQLSGRVLRTGYANIGGQDVAALRQADSAVQAALAARKGQEDELRAEIQAKVDAFNSKWAGVVSTPQTEVAHEAEWAKVQEWVDSKQKRFAAALEKAGELRLVGGTGFSLDPTHDYASLARSLANDKDRLVAVGVPAKPLSEAIAALRSADPDVVPLMKLMQDLRSDKDTAPLQYLLSERYLEKYSYQVARYDGPLGGTEAGMTLFYTDLLAKLWALNFHQGTPSQVIPDFAPMTRVKVSTVYSVENEAISATRLWFGPEDSGYQAVADDQILFGRLATRIYAASSDPLVPGKEVAPNAESEAFLGWWNDHYEEVARYEPRYQQLNEIMKWSLLIAWLDKAGHETDLKFLDKRTVDKGAWFPVWARQHPQLRFGDWVATGFFQKGYNNSRTEAMPLLSSDPYGDLGSKPTEGYPSYTLRGGVSLASRDAFEARSLLQTKVPMSVRKAGLDYTSVENDLSGFKTLRGADYRFGSASPLKGGPFDLESTLKVAAPAGAKFRTAIGDIVRSDYRRTIRQDEDGFIVQMVEGDTDVGALKISSIADGLRVSWEARDFDDGFELARKLSTSADPVQALKNDSVVQYALQQPGSQSFLVQMVGSGRWIALERDFKISSEIPDGWVARVADLNLDAKPVRFRWVSENDLSAALADGKWIRGPPAGSGGTPKVRGRGDFPYADSDQVAMAVDDIVHDGKAWLSNQRAIYQDELAGLDKIILAEPRRATERIIAAQDRYGNTPELLIRQAIAEIRSDADALAAVTVNRISPEEKDASSILDELNSWLGKDPAGRGDSLTRVADAVDWKASGTLRQGERINAVATEKNLGLQVKLKDADLQVMKPGDSFDDAPIYINDAPSLSTLDWSPTPAKSLESVITHGFGKVYKLQRRDIAHYRPLDIVVEAQQQKLHNVGATGASRSLDVTPGHLRYVRWNQAGGGSDCRSESGDDCDHVYVVQGTSGSQTAMR